MRAAPLRAPRLLERLAARGASAQAAIAGVYAWAVTVAPAALWERGAERGEPTVGAVAAAVGLAALLAAGVAERVSRGRGRVASLWVFVLASALVWLSAPAALRPTRIDTPRGLTGMLGWAVFAFASAGPALGDRQAPERVVDEAPLEARNRLARGDAAYPVTGAAAALALQFIGWHLVSPERALLVRLVALAAGLAIVGVAAEIALARHTPRARRDAKARLRSASAGLLLLALLGGFAIADLLFTSRG